MSYGAILKPIKKIYNYHIVSYYPNILSREFINIGIICGNETELNSLFLSDEYIEMINCNYLSQKKRIIKSLIEHIKSELDDKVNILQIKNCNLYFNNFKFLNEELLFSMDDINIVTKDLFFQYIGYKFVKEEKKDKRIIIKEKIIDEVNKNFNKSLSYSQNDEFYDLVIKNKKDSKPYKTIIGSLLNDNDVSRAMKVYLNSKVVKNHSIFSYFNSLDELSKHEKKSQNSLSFLESKIDMRPICFSDENISNALEMILK